MRYYLACAIAVSLLFGLFPSPSSAQASARNGVEVEVEASSSLQKAVAQCIDERLAEKKVGRKGLRLHVIALDSQDMDVYCDAIITLSAVLTDENGRLFDHFAATFPSGSLENKCALMVREFDASLRSPQ